MNTEAVSYVTSSHHYVMFVYLVIEESDHVGQDDLLGWNQHNNKQTCNGKITTKEF